MSGEFSKSPTTSSLQDSSLDVLEHLVSEEEDSEMGRGGGPMVETSGLTVVTVDEGESMVLDSGQVSSWILRVCV